MKGMKRITPEEVVAAYKATGLVPVQEAYVDHLINPVRVCGCGLTAMAVASGAALEAWDEDESNLIVSYLVKQGYDSVYLNGFTGGFDGDEFESIFEKKRIGAQDGKSAWNAVRHMAEEGR